MDRADPRDQNRKFLVAIAVLIVPFVAGTTLLLTSVFGPSDLGVRCMRQGRSQGRCEVLQSRFLGLAADSSFEIPESEIAGVRAVCAHGHVGGRAGPSCSVDLLLKSAPYRTYPVLSYPVSNQAEASARKLNEYFADPARLSIVMKDQIGSTVLIVAGLPLLTIALVLALRRWRRRRV